MRLGPTAFLVAATGDFLAATRLSIDIAVKRCYHLLIPQSIIRSGKLAAFSF